MQDDSYQLLANDYELDNNLIRTSFLKESYIPDHITQLFEKDIEVTKENIKDLNQRIVNKVKTHDYLGLLVSVDIKFEDRKSLHFGKWADYLAYEWEEISPISNIVITWTMNLKVHNLPTPQKHILTVKLSNGIKTEEMLNIIFAGKLNDVADIESNFFPVVAQCTFIHRTFGNELIGIVSNWVDSVERTTWAGRKVMLFLKKNISKISIVVQFLTRFIILIGSLFAYVSVIESNLPDNLFLITKIDIITIIKNTGFLLMLWQFTGYISRWFGKTIYEIIRDYGHSYIFSLTKKDLERRNKMQKQNTYDKIKLGLVMLGNFSVNIFFIFLDRLI